MSTRAINSPLSNVHMSDISSTTVDQSSSHNPIPPAPPTPIQVLMSAGTPLFIPRVNSYSNLNALNDDGFSLTSEADQHNITHSTQYANHSFSQILSNSHLHDQIATEIDYSTYLGKQKHLFAHTPGTTYYHSQSLFSVSYKKLLSILTFLFTLHWFNHGIFQTILTRKSEYNLSQTALILSASIIAIAIFAPIIGYVVRSHPPLRLLWIGFCIILISTFITAFARDFTAMFIARFMVGIGDAIIIPIAYPLVLYTAPPSIKSLMLSIFLCSIPLGYSMGYFVSYELLDSLPSLNLIDKSWQRLFCWETIFLIPIIGYSWWKVEGPDSFLAMADYNKKTHNIWDILTNQLYLGIVIGHTVQGFGCCVLTLIVWNKLNNSSFAGNGKGFELDIYEIWSLSIFILGTIGILLGGLAVDYVHNKSVFHKKKRKKSKKKKRRGNAHKNGKTINGEECDKLIDNEHKPSMGETSNIGNGNGDIDNGQSLGCGVNEEHKTMPQKTSPILLAKSYTKGITGNKLVPPINATMDDILSPNILLSNNTNNTNNTNNSNDTTSNQWSLNSAPDPNRKESIEDYKLRKFIQQQRNKLKHSLSHIAPIAPEAPKQSLAALKKEQQEAKRKKEIRRKRRSKRRQRKETMKKFKSTTNLHTIRICLQKVIIPTSLICLICIILLFFFKNYLWSFGILALMAQILTFIQISALYTSMLWCIGIEWQGFACGVAEIGFHLAGDGISPGLVTNLLLGDAFQFDLLVLIIVMLISILIFFISWKFVDYQIWNITKNTKNSKMFDLLHDETITTTDTTTTTTSSRYHDINNNNNNNMDDDDDYNEDSYSSSNRVCREQYNHNYDNESNSDYSRTGDNSEYSGSDWKPDNY